MIGQQLTFDAAPDELNLFMSEGEEQLEILSRDILRLEHEGDTNSELLQEIFRAAHTLKGSSGAIGHQRMARLTHALETVLDQVRQHKLHITTQLIDLLLKGLDALRVLLDEVSTCVESDVTIDDLCTALIALANGQAPTAPVASTAPVAAAAAAPTAPVVASPTTADVATPAPTWRIVTKIDDTCALPAARALQVILAASLAGTVVASQPTQDEVEALKVEAGAQVAFTLTSAHPEDETSLLIYKAMGRIPEISIVSVTSPTGDASAPLVTAAGDDAAPVWRIEAIIDSECLLPAVRALQVILAISVVGTLTDCNPSRDEVEAGNVAVGAHISFQVAMPVSDTDAEAHLRAVIGRINEVSIASITSPTGVTSAVVAQPEHHKPLPTAKIDAAELASVMAAQPRPVAAPTPTPTPLAPVAVARPAEQHSEGGEVNRPAAAATHAPRMVRIDVERLDALMNLVGELVIDRTRLARITTKVSAHTDDQNIVEELTETCRHLARISDDLQDEVMRSRMLPIESVFSKFPRLVRDLAQRVNKKIDFVVEGKDTELDRSVAEQISDPIIHLLRNSIDHGIEAEEIRRRDGKSEVGQVRLSARHEENQIVIDIEDDGKGISPEFLKNKAVSRGLITAEAAARMSNREATELIFASGFSTAEQVSDISGRGVGMDIVRTNVERLNGTITVETEVGQGTRFTVRLPLTLAIIRALLVDVAGQTYAIPLTSVVEALRIEKSELRAVNGREAIELRGQVLPLLRLADIFRSISKDLYAHTISDPEATRHFVVAVRWGDRRGGLIVDSLIGEQEIVIKSLGQLFRGAHGISGGAVLGDGQVAPILDIAALIKHIIAEERSSQPQGLLT